MAKIKCESCGSTRWQNSQLDNMLECQYCGAMRQQPNQNRINQQANNKQNWGTIAVALPLIVVFVQFRKHSDYEAVTSTKQPLINAQTPEISTVKQGNAATQSIESSHTTTTNHTLEKSINTYLKITHQVAGETSLGGKFWIFELNNQSEQAIAKPGVVVSGFDANGQRLVEQSGWSQQQVLAPNETTALMVFLSEPPDDMVSTTISTLGKIPQKYDLKQVSLKVKSFVVNEVGSRYEIVGDVLNDTEHTLSFSKITVIAKNKAGQAVGVTSGFATVKSLKPQESSGFKVTMGTFLTEKPDSWTLKAFARPVD